MKRSLILTVIVGGALLSAACSNSTAPQGSQVALSFSGTAPAAGPVLSRAAAAPLTDALGNTLDVTRAQVVLREIDLKRTAAACPAVDTEDDGCEKFEAGPVLVDLPLDGSTAQQVAVNIPPGTYSEVEFEIHKISSSDAEDAAFRTANPDFAGISIKVDGMYNGQAFTYTTDLDVEQEFDLMPPLVVDSVMATNVTVRIDISQWFQDATGNFVDPASANKGGQNESIVNENIKQSIEAFEDRDRDGDDRDEG